MHFLWVIPLIFSLQLSATEVYNVEQLNLIVKPTYLSANRPLQILNSVVISSTQPETASTGNVDKSQFKDEVVDIIEPIIEGPVPKPIPVKRVTGDLTPIPAQVTQYDDLAKKELLSHLEIINLAGTSKALSRDYQELLITNKPFNLVLPDIEVALLKFWNLKDKRTDADNFTNNYKRVLALEPNSDLINVRTRIQYLKTLTDPWPLIKLPNKLNVGFYNANVPAIAEILKKLGDLDDGVEVLDNRYTKDLEEGIIKFQKRHGLLDDGIIGKSTVKWLNTDPKTRIHILAYNYVKKSLFWPKLGESYVLVNIPDFKLKLVDLNKLVLESDVIVGKVKRPTPEIDSEISNVIINPTWRVPKSLVQDVANHVRKEPDYLDKHQFNVYDKSGALVVKTEEEWQTQIEEGKFNYNLEQLPGNTNSLGRYKFHFNNTQSIYLHDTPSKSLFKRNDRALSSGCVRVKKVVELANWMGENLINDTKTWNKYQDDTEHTKWFTLKRNIPVHLVYWTAWMEGSVAQFRNDIYKQVK